jgi:hypothetical protein
MEPIVLTPFQSIVERLMTDDEIRERAKEHLLSEDVIQYILETFHEAHVTMESMDLSEDDFARGDGRLGCNESHQDVWDGLALAMGVPEEEITGGDLSDKYPNVELVFQHFFDE